MFKLIVSMTDGAVKPRSGDAPPKVADEYLCETREGAYTYLRKLKHVSAWEIIEL